MLVIRRFAAATLLAILLPVVLSAEPRSLSDAEAAAVRFVSGHLQSGPQALWGALSSSSRFRTFGEAEGLKEIELRVGPHAGAEWELVTLSRERGAAAAAFRVTFPSGIDDTVVFDLKQENGAWKIADIRSMSDPARVVHTSAPTTRVATQSAVKANHVAAAGALSMLLMIAAMLFYQRSLRLALILGGTSVAAVGVAATLHYIRHAAMGDTTAVVAASALRARSPETSRQIVLDLRRRVAAGGDVPHAEFHRAALDPAWRDRALLWSAQLHLQQNDRAGARAALRDMRNANDTPLAQILQGRLSFMDNKEVDAVMAYERAMELGPERDDLLYESASVLMNSGFDDRAERYFRKLDEMGSREADAYYSLAALEAMKGHAELAEPYLLRAYAMRPELRSAFVRMGVFFEVLRRPAVQQQFAMHQSAEPLVRPQRVAERPLDVATGSIARCLGDYLEIDFLGGVLKVPGGAYLAPAGATVVAADAWEDDKTSAARSDVTMLARVAAQPSSYAQPALSRRISETANALVEHNRWSDVAALTQGISPDSELVPVDLLLTKALSLKRTGKAREARALLETLAARPALLRRLDARQLLEAGELLASVDSYELAIKLMDRAGQLRELPFLDDRVRQLQLNQRITTYSSHQTPHFTIRYSQEMTERAAQRLGEIAEAELTRLQKWIAVANFQPVVINLISWETFRATYTGNDHVLGFYDGKITVPFAGIGVYPPEIVAILSHELAHAMISQRTNEQAPRWFQEGLAQRIESVQYKANPFNMYEVQQMPALAILDDAIGGSPDPDVVGQGYIVAQSLIRYIEARWGTAGIGRFLDGFAAGRTTGEIVASMGAQSLSTFDDAFRTWGAGKREVYENTELVSYADEQDAIVIRRKR